MSRNGNRHSPDRSPVGSTPSPAEIIEAPRVPRVELRIVFRLRPGMDSAKTTLAAAIFLSGVLGLDRKLRLSVDPLRSTVASDEVSLFLVPVPLGVETAARLEKVAGVVREAVVAFEGATLSRVEVVPQT